MLGSKTLASRLATVAATVAAAVVVGAGVAACSAATPSSSSPAASPADASASSTAASPVPPSASMSVSASVSTPASQQAASPTPSSTLSASPAVASCPTRYLGPHIGLSQGAAGSIYQVIYFTNISNAPCTLYGYPGVALAGGSPQVNQIGAAASRSTATSATLVTLAPGQSASTTLRIIDAGNYPSATCKPAASTFLQIFPPNQTTPIYLAYKATGCASASVILLSVTVMSPGTGG